MATAREENMENELTLEEAQKVIKEYGITPDAYMAANLNHFMSGSEPDDNSVELDSYYTHCLQIVVNNGLAVATKSNEPSPSRQVETLVVPHATLLEIEKLKKDVEAWKQECEMYANAWQRELGGVYNKTHFIDALVVTTRAMKKQLNAFLGVAKKDFR